MLFPYRVEEVVHERGPNGLIQTSWLSWCNYSEWEEARDAYRKLLARGKTVRMITPGGEILSGDIQDEPSTQT